MLSVLIPVYNFNIVDLAREIHRQASETGIAFEIIILDDGSSILGYRNENRQVSRWNNVRYEELPVNSGRAKIRNHMASIARFPWLLFIDCDSLVPRHDYIATFLAWCKKEAVICGGRTYTMEKPADPARYLRWRYGRMREERTAAERNRQPWNSFMTNNFVAARSIFDRLSFDESIRNYGHEDTFFGIELKRKNIPVIHIDNPLTHIGLETHTEFLEKTAEGVSNLVMLINRKAGYKQEMVSAIRLLRHFSWIRRMRLQACPYILLAVVGKILISNLTGNHPSLFLFDLYKLGLMAKFERTYTKSGRNSTALT